MIDAMLRWLKRIPVDLGQESVADRTMGKRIAMDMVPDVPRGQVRRALDVGCREGTQSRRLEGKGYRVTSIDITSRYENCIIVDVNAGVPFSDGQFDVVWCSEVIEHLRDPREAVGELLRVTRRGGDLLVTTPNSYFWLFRLFGLLGLPPHRLQREDHLHYFRLADVERLFPGSRICGFFPYLLVKRRIEARLLVGALSPTFVVHVRKG